MLPIKLSYKNDFRMKVKASYVYICSSLLPSPRASAVQRCFHGMWLA